MLSINPSLQPDDVRALMARDVDSLTKARLSLRVIRWRARQEELAPEALTLPERSSAKTSPGASSNETLSTATRVSKRRVRCDATNVDIETTKTLVNHEGHEGHED